MTNDSTFGRYRSSGKPGSRPAGHNGNPGAFCGFDNSRNLVDVPGYGDDFRQGLEDRPVLLVNHDIFFLCEDVRVADDASQFGDEPGVSGGCGSGSKRSGISAAWRNRHRIRPR